MPYQQINEKTLSNSLIRDCRSVNPGWKNRAQITKQGPTTATHQSGYGTKTMITTTKAHGMLNRLHFWKSEKPISSVPINGQRTDQPSLKLHQLAIPQLADQVRRKMHEDRVHKCGTKSARSSSAWENCLHYYILHVPMANVRFRSIGRRAPE